jgi:hypothetical protein
MADEPDVVTDYATLLKAQVQYKVCSQCSFVPMWSADSQAILLQTNRPLRAMLALMLPSLAKHRKCVLLPPTPLLQETDENIGRGKVVILTIPGKSGTSKLYR